jgi:DNA-binding NarL/FixJ family response regulator
MEAPVGSKWGQQRRIRVLTVAAEPALHELIRHYLANDLRLATVGMSGGADAMRQLHTYAPDLIVIDVLLPQENALALARRLRAARPAAQIVMFGLYGTACFGSMAAAAGTAGFIPLDQLTPDALLAAIGAPEAAFIAPTALLVQAA